METATTKRVRPETVLLIIALLAATLVTVLLVLSLPRIAEDLGLKEPPTEATAEETTEPATEPTTEATEPETTEETEPPLPPPPPNLYSVNDFQYNDKNFLTCLSGDYMVGIDVSRYQFDIDWAQVADYGVEFAMIRVGYRGYETGALAEDPNAKANLQGASDAGIRVGVYFFSQAITPEEAEEEARFVLEYIQEYDVTMPVVFDWELPDVENPRTLEVDARTLTDCALAFCRVIEEAGYQPMVYFNTNQARDDLYIAELTDYPFWLALYTPRMRFPYKIRMWQYTDSGTIPGIEASVDLNIWLED